MSLTKVNYIDNSTIITAKNLNDIQDNIVDIQDNIVELQDNLENIKIKPKAGFIYPLASSVVPEGFLLCDGAEYLRSEYPELFAAIGTIYGSGNGSTTFNVPNLQIRVPVGAGDGYKLGDVGGMETHKHTDGDFRAMIGAATGSPSTLNYVATSGSNPNTGATRTGTYTIVGASYRTGDGFAHYTPVVGYTSTENNMQPYTVVNYIIATGKNTGVSAQNIITGVQTLPLGVEYGGTGATNAEDARNNLGAMSKMELLWENASPESVFNAQTVSIDLGDYTGVCISYIGHRGNGAKTTSGILFKNSGINFIQYCGRTATIEDFDVSWRNLTISDTGIEFQDCEVNELKGSEIGSTSNTGCIPYRIYGIKGVL